MSVPLEDDYNVLWSQEARTEQEDYEATYNHLDFSWLFILNEACDTTWISLTFLMSKRWTTLHDGRDGWEPLHRYLLYYLHLAIIKKKPLALKFCFLQNYVMFYYYVLFIVIYVVQYYVICVVNLNHVYCVNNLTLKHFIDYKIQKI